jgi:type IV secretory pathway VirB10-like protein
VAWTRIILLDSSSIDLGRMPAPIRAGSPALHDQVSTHFWEMISSTLMLSVISAGVQISQGSNTASFGGLNALQSMAGSDSDSGSSARNSRGAMLGSRRPWRLDRTIAPPFR